jgi:hypothetical protein
MTPAEMMDLEYVCRMARREEYDGGTVVSPRDAVVLTIGKDPGCGDANTDAQESTPCDIPAPRSLGQGAKRCIDVRLVIEQSPHWRLT